MTVTAHQRTRHTRWDGSHLTFSYDNLSQLTVVRATNSGGVLITGETKGYLYDVAQNLNVRTNHSSGSTTTFSVNPLNQLTSGPYGNVISDNSHTYTYDAENQLTQVLWGGGSYRTDLVYDGLGRLRKRTESYYSGGWSLLSETRYLYDGRRVIQERNGSNTPTVSYTRGNDLSGSLEEAGGIGGLLARSHGYSGGSWATHNCYHADGGGNITYLMSSSQGFSARYTYDAYGNTVSSSGPLASANVYRFSSKEWVYDGAGGNYYYGYRWYHPNLQRWLNRDPLGEAGGINLYGFVGNNPLDAVDPDGRVFFIPIVIIGGSLVADYLYERFLEPKVNRLIDEHVPEEYQSAVHTGKDLFDLARACKNLRVDKVLNAGRKVGHHSIPKASQKKMQPEVREDPRVRGKKGDPNVRPVDEAAHKQAHSSPPGQYYRGGDYSKRYDELVGDYDNLAAHRAREIRDQCMQEFLK